VELAEGTVTKGDLAGLRRADARFEAAGGPGHAASSLKLGTRSGNGASIAGVDGFLFIADGVNRWEQQYLNAQPLPDTHLDSWLRIFEQRKAEADRRGVQLCNLVIPEKQVLFPEKRWPVEVHAGTGRPWRQLESRLGTHLQTLYGEPILRAAQASAPCYFRHNSHCTPSGCCALAQGVLEALGSSISLETLHLTYIEGERAHDLSLHLFDPAPLEGYAWLHPCGEIVFDNKGFELTGRYGGSAYGIRNSHAPDPRTAIIFGDSYSYDVGLTFALSAAFAHTVFVWSKAVLWDAVERHNAQVVIWESAERFLTSLPEA